MKYITIILLTSICWLTVIGLLVVDYQRSYRQVEHEMSLKCEDDSKRAADFGRERALLYIQVNWLKSSRLNR